MAKKSAEAHKKLDKIIKNQILVETMNECFWVGDASHKTIYVNPVFEKTSGYSLDEAIGKTCNFFFDKESKKTLEEHHKLRTQGKSSQYEVTMVSKSGKRIPLLGSGAPLADGGTIGIFTNLSKLKKLADKERITQEILRASADAIVILDKKRIVKLWSNGATRLYGYKEEEILNKTIDILIPEQEAETNKKLIEEVETKGYIKNIEARRITKQKNLIDVSVSVSKVIDSHQKLIGYLIIYRDVTLQKRSKDELQKRFETIQDAYKELGLQRRQLDYLYEIIDNTISVQKFDQLCKLIVSALYLLTKCDGTVMRLYDEKRNILKLQCCFGVNPKWLDKNQIKFENSIAEEAFKKRRPLIIDDIDIYAKHQGQKLLKSHSFKTLILLPLFIQNKFLGSISLYSNAPEKFRLIETDFLEKISKQTALAIFAKLMLK
ncbi:MAG: PAS domain S-box protein [Patescibacteria group bacterium]